MSKSYDIEKFPKNKEDDLSKLSNHQVLLRKKAKIKKDNIEDKTCKRCSKKLPINEFYVKNKATGRRDSTCRDCRMELSGVLEIGKARFAKKIFSKSFRRCSTCKNIKPLTEYSKNKSAYGGYSHNCNQCAYEKSREYIVAQRKNIGLFFIKRYGKSNYGIENFDKKTIKKLKAEILAKREVKYRLDNQDFYTKESLARYIEDNYDVSYHAAYSRLISGKSAEECIIPEFELRSECHTKGKIKVTDTITNEVFIFSNTQDPGILKMFSKSAISRCVKKGGITRVISKSKYKNPCKIERISND